MADGELGIIGLDESLLNAGIDIIKGIKTELERIAESTIPVLCFGEQNETKSSGSAAESMKMYNENLGKLTLAGARLAETAAYYLEGACEALRNAEQASAEAIQKGVQGN